MIEFQATVQRRCECTVSFKAESEDEAREIAKKLFHHLSPEHPMMPPSPGQVMKRKIKNGASSGHHDVSLAEYKDGRFIKKIDIWRSIGKLFFTQGRI